MPSPISRRPAGLLDLLLTQQQGANPRELRDDVQPIIDMSAFYESERLAGQSNGIAVTANGPQTADQITIPDGEYWKVLGFGAYFDPSVNNMAVGLSFWARLSNVPLPLTEQVYSDQIGATSFFSWGELLPQPIHFPSGTSFFIDVGRILLQGQPNALVTQYVLYVRMET